MVKVVSMKTVRGKVTVELDNGRRYHLKPADLVGFPISEDTEIDEAVFERKVLLSQYPEALNTAVAMLARRACSRKEIRDKLLSRGWCEETADIVLTKLDQKNLIDDRDFSDQWARYRSSGHYGTNRIYRELRFKGVDEETARAAVGSLDEEEQLNAAFDYAVKASSRSKPGEDIRKSRSRVMQSLVRRGFSWEIARAACGRIFDPDDDE